MAILEICVESLAGARTALAAGADRLELCAALAVGGLTPTPALVALVSAAAAAEGRRVHAMVRPRAGDFAYTADERDLIAAEMRATIAAGADGLVFGAAIGDRPDIETLGWFAATARALRPDIDLTLHRAVDLLADPVDAVEPAAALGYHRILSSGGARGAADGIETLTRMTARAAGRIAIMPGAGVRAGNAAAILAATGAKEIHASASAPAASDPRLVALGFAAADARTTSGDAVAALRASIDAG